METLIEKLYRLRDDLWNGHYYPKNEGDEYNFGYDEARNHAADAINAILADYELEKMRNGD